MGVGGWTRGPAGPGQRSLLAGTNAGGGTVGSWGVVIAHDGLW